MKKQARALPLRLLQSQQTIAELEEMEQSSQEDLFRELFQGDASDNDDALDQEWVASDCETDGVQTSCKREPELNRKDVSRDHDHDLLSEFYMWLVDVDGGYQNEKSSAKHYAEVDPHRNSHHKKSGKMPFSTFAVIPGKDGDTFLKSWLSYAVNRYQPGTVQSCLMSLRLFYKFLIQEQRHCQCYPGDIKCMTRPDEFMVSGTEEKGCQEEARKA